MSQCPPRLRAAACLALDPFPVRVPLPPCLQAAISVGEGGESAKDNLPSTLAPLSLFPLPPDFQSLFLGCSASWDPNDNKAQCQVGRPGPWPIICFPAACLPDSFQMLTSGLQPWAEDWSGKGLRHRLPRRGLARLVPAPSLVEGGTGDAGADPSSARRSTAVSTVLFTLQLGKLRLGKAV